VTLNTMIRSVCAVGVSGQMGLRGRLPWEGFSDPIFAKDAARFFELTRGHVLIAGPKTVESIPAEAYQDRDIITIRSNNSPQDVVCRFPGRIIFIGGGTSVWDAYAPLISHWDITRLPYDGDADRWFDSAWLMPTQRGANNISVSAVAAGS
jgi:dihydromethanopterin reductase